MPLVTKYFLESLAVLSGARPAGGSMGGNLFPSAPVSMRDWCSGPAQGFQCLWNSCWCHCPCSQQGQASPVPEQPWHRLRAYSCPWRGSHGSPGTGRLSHLSATALVTPPALPLADPSSPLTPPCNSLPAFPPPPMLALGKTPANPAASISNPAKVLCAPQHTSQLWQLL